MLSCMGGSAHSANFDQSYCTLLMRPEMIFSMILAGFGLPPLPALLA